MPRYKSTSFFNAASCKVHVVPVGIGKTSLEQRLGHWRSGCYSLLPGSMVFGARGRSLVIAHVGRLGIGGKIVGCRVKLTWLDGWDGRGNCRRDGADAGRVPIEAMSRPRSRHQAQVARSTSELDGRRVIIVWWVSWGHQECHAFFW